MKKALVVKILIAVLSVGVATGGVVAGVHIVRERKAAKQAENAYVEIMDDTKEPGDDKLSGGDNSIKEEPGSSDYQNEDQNDTLEETNEEENKVPLLSKIKEKLTKSGSTGDLSGTSATHTSLNSNDTPTGRTTYYQVSFAAGNGVNASEVVFPEPKMYVAGDRIGALSVPFKANSVFLGWYYDAGYLREVAENDSVNRNITLYAKFVETTNLNEVETPGYTTVNIAADDVAAYSFGIDDYNSSDVEFVDISGGGASVAYSVGADGTVNASLEQGKTYKVTLADDTPDTFVLGGVRQLESVRVLNIITEKDDTLNVSLSNDISYIPASNISNMSGELLDGLFMASVASQSVSATDYSGTFVSDESFEIGSTVAIYSGTRPDRRELNDTDNDSVAYVTITDYDEDTHTYTYSSADPTDVLFIPDVFLVPADADTDGNASNHSITVPESVMDFSEDAYLQYGLDATSKVEAGDFISFYEGSFASICDTTPCSYAKITAVSYSESDEEYTIAYADADEDEIAASMDIYGSRNEEIVLTDTEIRQIEREMESQAVASGFVDEAAEYLTALALETDGFKELSGDLDMDLKSYNITFADGSEVTDDDMMLMSGSTARITEKQVRAAVAAGKVLQHFEDSFGVRAELSMTFTVEIGDHFEINLEAIFEQEVLLNMNVSGGAIVHWKWIIPIIDDYELNANIDVGTFTAVGITATAHTKDDEIEEGYNWQSITGTKAEEKLINIGKQITDLLDEKDSFLGEKLLDEDGELFEWAGSNGGGLAEKYADFMEEANDSWVEILRVNIFSTEGTVDPMHILCYGVKADFVVQANLYVTMGMTFEYGNAKRYNFHVYVLSKQSTNETIDLEESNYNFDFYVMGTLGIKAGIELELAVGLFSLKLDSIGICAQAGAYAQLWGYFYYHCSWTKSGGKDSGYSGALLIEIGMYLEVSFKAQLFSSEKLTYKPTLYENQWPILQIGDNRNIYGFTDNGQRADEIEMVGSRSQTLSDNIFDMNYLDLRTGDLYGSDSDEDDDNPALSLYSDRADAFTYELSNPKFSYSLSANAITVNPAGSLEEDCTLTIIYKGGTLAFTSKPISRKITIHWSDPEGGRFIQFDSNGGSNVKTITTGVGARIFAPYNPTKAGYVFDGWYTDKGLTTPFEFPNVMPDYATAGGKGIMVYAKWIVATNTKYAVKHYLQQRDGSYELIDTQVKNGTTGAYTAATAKTGNGFEHYTPKTINQVRINADGSSIVNIYYERNLYTLTFTFGDLYDEDDPNTWPICITGRYETFVSVPNIAMPGYWFNGFNDDNNHAAPIRSNTENPEDMGIYLTANATYHADWETKTSTPYRVEVYTDRDGGAYKLYKTVTGYGRTNSAIDVSEAYPRELGCTLDKATVNGQEVDTVRIKGDGSTVLKMYYTRSSYTLTYESYCELEYPQRTIKWGDPIPRPTPDPELEGFTFNGWCSDLLCHDHIDFATAKMPYVNYTIYADWVRRTTTAIYVEHYIMDTNGQYSEEPYFRDTQTVYSDVPLTLSTLKDTDYEVAGGIEYKKAVVNDAEVTSITPTWLMTVKLYYERKSYELSYDFDGGSLQSGSYSTAGSYYYGTTLTAPSLTKGGYNLTWSPNAPSLMPNHAATYTAVWTNTPQRKITFKSVVNGAAGTHVWREIYVDSGTALGSILPSDVPGEKSNYTFDGWCSDAACTTAVAAGDTTAINSDMTLYAHYTPQVTTDYGIQVAGVAVTDVNKDDIFEMVYIEDGGLPYGGTVSGKASYSFGENFNRITLEDFVFTHTADDSLGIAVSDDRENPSGHLEVRIKGECSITNTKQTQMAIGIYSNTVVDLEFMEGSSLSMNICAPYSFGVFAWQLTVDGYSTSPATRYLDINATCPSGTDNMGYAVYTESSSMRVGTPGTYKLAGATSLFKYAYCSIYDDIHREEVEYSTNPFEFTINN